MNNSTKEQLCIFCNLNKATLTIYPSTDGSDDNLDMTKPQPCCTMCEDEMIKNGDLVA